MANTFFNPKTYTVESVTNGHPDKICDQISDAILDACLSQDPQSRVARETVGAHGIIFIGGEVTTKAHFSPASIARKVYKRTGYKDKVKIITNIIRQSTDISQGVNKGGAGDQGIMYGYATNETPEYLPQGVVFAHNLVKKLKELREARTVEWLMPDGKAQVTMVGNKVETVLVSTQHTKWVNNREIHKFIKDNVIKPVIGSALGSNILVNPTGRFVLGGFIADTGLTGRKIMVDTYGGLIPHGGGCFSGKDPTKVDRSGGYMCRYVAKNIVAKGLAKSVLVSVAYAIGKTEPLMVEAINEKGKNLNLYLKKHFDFRPQAIIERLNLRRPIYQQTAVYGHFGRDGFPWEEIAS